MFINYVLTFAESLSEVRAEAMLFSSVIYKKNVLKRSTGYSSFATFVFNRYEIIEIFNFLGAKAA